MPVRYKTTVKSLLGLSFIALPVHAVQTAETDTNRVCQPAAANATDFSYPEFEQSLTQDEVAVRSQQAEIFNDQRANFFGDVVIQRNSQWLMTESATVDQTGQTIEAKNGVRFTDGFINVTGDSFYFDGNSEVAELRQTNYQMASTNARGTAGLLQVSTQHVSLLDSSFTTCPTPEPAWQLTAERIEINETSDYGEAWDAKLRLFDVPVFYLPYFTFPVNDSKKTGFLYPTIDSSSNNGIELEIPYYFNIAPNMDATIAPVYTSERGTMLKSEYRYLFSEHAGQVNIEYLPNDQARTDRADRYLWHVNHATQFNDNWSAFIDATQISDDNYLNDFGSDFAGRADTHLYRVAQIDYLSSGWHFQLRTEDYELLGQYRSPYRTLPQLSLNYATAPTHGFQLNWNSELTYFQDQARSSNHATRAHTAPSFSYSFEQPAYDAEAEISYLLTHYRQQNENTQLADEVTRELPRARLRARLHLERLYQSDGDSFRQTLEPQIQYLYVPYENQQSIGVYDTTLMQDDYNGLFRPQRFSGLDRIAEANQITYGASSSIFDEKERELLRVSLGQIYYFDESRTTLLNERLNDRAQITSSNSEWVADINWALSPQWTLRSSVQYDTELNRTRKSQSALEYRQSDRKLVQLNHRKATNIFNTDIEQVGTQAVWELNKQWQVAANVYYDLSHDRVNDAVLGMQYTNCCWAVRVSAYRRINRNFETANNFAVQNDSNPTEFDNGVSLQFIISGLSADSGSLIEMLENSIYGYRRPFYLSN
ncbi:MAG: LPS-assembly protein LptD [Pseudomonadota bacterium]